MADAIADDYADDELPPLFIKHHARRHAVRGAIAFALGERDRPEFDYLHATRYRGATTGLARFGCIVRPRCAGAACCWDDISTRTR